MKIKALVAVSALVLAAACQPATQETAPATPAPDATAAAPATPATPGATTPADIVDTAVANGQFNTLASALRSAGLVETLKGAGPFTVFAPTDAAFAALPQDAVANLLKPENKAQLTSVLTYHVVPGRIMAADLAGKSQEVKTVEGRTLRIDATGGSVRVNDATVTTPDVNATNGVIHVIDKVLMPAA